MKPCARQRLQRAPGSRPRRLGAFHNRGTQNGGSVLAEKYREIIPLEKARVRAVASAHQITVKTKYRLTRNHSDLE